MVKRLRLFGGKGQKAAEKGKSGKRGRCKKTPLWSPLGPFRPLYSPLGPFPIIHDTTKRKYSNHVLYA